MKLKQLLLFNTSFNYYSECIPSPSCPEIPEILLNSYDSLGLPNLTAESSSQNSLIPTELPG